MTKQNKLEPQDIAKQNSRYVHYEKLRERAGSLTGDLAKCIAKASLDYKLSDQITRHQVYQLENVCQLLCITLATLTPEPNHAEAIHSAIQRDREINAKLRKEYSDDCT
jgi:hypothetical protein